jgi:hypothetical protein
MKTSPLYRIFRIPRTTTRVIANTVRGYEFGRLREIHRQVKEFRRAPDNLRSSKVEATTSLEVLISCLDNIGVPLRKTHVEVEDFVQWKEKHPLLASEYLKMGDVYIEKMLEHYVTMTYLPILATDRVIDVAAAYSPFVESINRTNNTPSYRLDLIYKPGLNGDQIGGDASAMPVPEGFADVLTLHCAFECFQDPSDVLFIKEAPRVLSEGRRLGIVPLYLDELYFIKNGPSGR